MIPAADAGTEKGGTDETGPLVSPSPDPVCIELWCKRCRVLRIQYRPDTGDPHVRFTGLNTDCVFCKGPLVPVTDKLKQEFPSE